MIEQIVNSIGAGVGAGGGFYALRWLILWITARHDRRVAQLDAEHERLDDGWRHYRLTLEQRVQRLESINEMLRIAFQDVAAALMMVDPQNDALQRTAELMKAAFPLRPEPMAPYQKEKGLQP